MMSYKRESTLQSIKQAQSIKDAGMYVGTIYCLLPDGTEPEVPDSDNSDSEDSGVDTNIEWWSD